MSEDTLDVAHITDLAEKAEVIADATNRRAEDVLADLLDDGQANMSAGTDAEQPDFLDKAQQQAEKLKGLLTTLIPIILMLGGIAAEGLGVLDLTSWGEESMWDNDPNNPTGNNIYWGCMNPNAFNYDHRANNDDGSCQFNNPPCNPEWQYDDYSSSNEDKIYVRFTFFDDNECNVELEGHFTIVLFRDGSSHDDDYIDTGVFRDVMEVQSDFIDLEEGTYDYEIEFHTLDCSDGTCNHGIEFTSPHKPTFIIEDPEIEGCIDSNANNYDEDATVDDGSCEFDPEPVEGCTNSTATNYDDNATVDDGTCTYPPPRCEITLFQINMDYNNTSAWVQYDLDCGTEPNDQDGYNVSVQFWNSENDTSLNYTIGYHYIKGYVADSQELCLENLTAGKYDFHWIAIWTNDDGEQGLLEVNWPDIEITGV